MTFRYHRSYRGKLQAVLLDWAGTTMDFGCMAPAVVFVQVYENKKVPITMDEARAPMGAHKRVHIQKISQLEAVPHGQEAPGQVDTVLSRATTSLLNKATDDHARWFLTLASPEFQLK